MDFKKSALALITLGIAGLAQAGGEMPVPSCVNHPVTVPCERSAWDIGFTALWVQPNNESMQTNYETTTGYPFENATYLGIKPNAKFAFGLEGSYHFGSGNDLTVNWMHYKKAFEEIEALNDYYTYFNGIYDASARFHYDAVNLEVGQMLDVGPNWGLRVHMGGQYVRINRTTGAAIAQSVATLQTTSEYFENKSHYKGYGPRAGFDAAYNFGGGFSLVGESAVSLTTGNSDEISMVVYQNAGSKTLDDTYHYNGLRIYVAGLDGKLGLRYTYKMNHGETSIEGGYTASVYFNPIATDNIYSNFGLGGGYVTLKYVS